MYLLFYQVFAKHVLFHGCSKKKKWGERCRGGSFASQLEGDSFTLPLLMHTHADTCKNNCGTHSWGNTQAVLTIRFLCFKAQVNLLVYIAQYFLTILFRHGITANSLFTADIEGCRMWLWDKLILFYCDMRLDIVLDWG